MSRAQVGNSMRRPARLQPLGRTLVCKASSHGQTRQSRCSLLLEAQYQLSYPGKRPSCSGSGHTLSGAVALAWYF
jgi:hypothetical protein